NRKKRPRNVVSMVRTADARMPAKESMVRKKASRSEVALYSRMSITNRRKWTAPRSAAYSAGLEEAETKERERKTTSTGKTSKYATTSRVAMRWGISAGQRRHQRSPL